MKLSLLLHAHQPPGNFDSVFQRAVDQCYGPVLDLIEARPWLRLSTHWSGSLLEWLETHAPERIEQLRRLVANGQVELVAAGMYEPVLALLSPADRLGQLRLHRATLRERFGVDATVGWLTERVWEPSLADELIEGGIRAVTLDDRHFLSAGVPPDELDAPYLTESQGRPLRVVPVSEPLRLAIPWHPVEEVMDTLRQAARAGRPMLAYADDIEKFGLWPGTHRDVIRGGWLRRFFDGLRTLDGVEVVPVGEAIAETPDRGRVYIPDGSYPEMLEWSLIPRTQRALRRTRAAIEAGGLTARVEPFIRVGQYREFLAKYPETNYLHKRMLDVSQRIPAALRRTDEGNPPPALRDLWRAQANCAYWHGMFGGLYLPHIRQRLWYHLLRAEQAIDPQPRGASTRVFDLEAEGRDDILVTTATTVTGIVPNEGTVVEWSDRARGINLVDTIARRDEAYHDEAAPPYAYDRGRRGLFVDRFLTSTAPPARGEPIEDAGDFSGRPYEVAVRKARGAVEVDLERVANAPGGRARIRKTLRIPPGAPALSADYRVEAEAGHLEGRLGVELNFGVCFLERFRATISSGSTTVRLPRGGALRAASTMTLVTDGLGVAVEVTVDPPGHVDARAITSVSRSEDGMDESAQEIALLLSWPLNLDAGGTFAARISLNLVPSEAPA